MNALAFAIFCFNRLKSISTLNFYILHKKTASMSPTLLTLPQRCYHIHNVHCTLCLPPYLALLSFFILARNGVNDNAWLVQFSILIKRQINQIWKLYLYCHPVCIVRNTRLLCELNIPPYFAIYSCAFGFFGVHSGKCQRQC